ncbi:MAG: serine/threonine-protein kinase [Cyanobacteria bacterium P01_A01_bin.84]
MLCCLNPDCPNPMNPDGIKYCQSCSAPLIQLLRGHYRVTGVLSDEGGFGKTYLAEDVDKLNEPGVVKQLAPKVHGTWALNKAIELFKQEAQRLQELGRHSQIPTLLAYFEQDSYLYLVQEFVDGNNLLKELQLRSIYKEAEIRAILLDLLPILKYIHERGVVHRDLKPQNIIYRQADDKYVLIDFGASKQLTATVQTKPGTTIGSFGYSPIEQIQGGEVCPASDFFSLGATCFHLLTNITPFQLWTQHGYAWVNNWQRHVKTPLSREIVQVLHKLLRKDIEERYQSADEVIQDLITPSTSGVSFTPRSSSLSSNSKGTKTVLRNPAAKQPLLPFRQSFNAASRNGSRRDKKLIFRLAIASAFTFLGLASSQVYGYLRYGFLLSNPVFLISSFPSSSYLQSTLIGHEDSVASLAYSPDAKSLASGSYDRTVKLWDTEIQQEIRTFKGHSGWIGAVVFGKNGKHLISGSYDKTIKFWDVTTGKEIRTFTGHSGSVETLALSPDNKTLISGSYDTTIKLWDLDTGEEIRTLESHFGKVAAIAVSTDGKTLVSGSDDKSIKVWSLETGELLRTFKGHKDRVSAVAINPDGKTIVSGSHDNTVKVWNLDTGEVLRTFRGHSNWITSVSINASGKLVASASGDSTIRIWNLETGEIFQILRGHSSYVGTVVFSPRTQDKSLNSQTLISSGMEDNTIKIWRMSP